MTRRASADIAEGSMHAGKARRHHFQIAIGSAAEVCAVLDLVAQPGGEEVQEQLRRAGIMLERLGAAG